MISWALLVPYSFASQQYAPVLHCLPCPANTSAYGKTHTVADTRPRMHCPAGWVVLVWVWVHTCVHAYRRWCQPGRLAPGGGTTPSFSSLASHGWLSGTCFDFVSSLSEAVEIAGGFKSYWGRGELRRGQEDEECRCVIFISLRCQVKAVCMHF